MRVDGVRIATIQGQKRITNKQLSAKSGVSECQISQIRNGRTTRALTAARLAAALDVPLSEILKEGEGK